MKKLFLVLFILISIGCSKKIQNSNVAKQDKKIVIIGAGIAGLSAAKYFNNRGIKTIILEAQNYVGGRIQTKRNSGLEFDTGASWIHKPKRNPISKIAHLAKAKTYLTDDENVVVYDHYGKKYADITLENIEKTYYQNLKKLEGSQNKSFGEIFFKQYPENINNPLWLYMLSAYLEFDTGADINKLSSIYYDDDKEFSGKDVFVTNGYDKITNYLKQDLNINLNSKVVQIDYSKRKITVNTNTKTYHAVPLGVLKNKIIDFRPKLPQKQQNAIDKLEMGSVNKFLLSWEKSFWDLDKQYIGYTSKTKGKFNYFLNLKHIKNSNTLMTFAFGDYAIKTELMSEKEVITVIMEQLKSIYGENIPNPTKMLRTKWKSNKYSFGAYSFVPYTAKSLDFKVFEESINNKIYFAGEHTSIKYRGTVHGAYLSGIREAKKIINQF